MDKPGSTAVLLPSKTPLSGAQKLRDGAFEGIGNLIKLLPTGTVFLFQFLNPVLTNNGYCTAAPSKVFTGILLSVCGFLCWASCLTDSYTGVDGRLHYGIVTTKGLYTFWDPTPKPDDIAKYKLRVGDFVHAFFSLTVFAVIGLLDPDTVGCLYPSFVNSERVLIMVLPPVIGGLAGLLFIIFPNTRHGIGYPSSPSTPTK